MLWKIKQPCEHCPFRRDVHPYLDPRHAQELADALSDDRNWFACHQTTGQTRGRRVRPEKQSHCIGAAIVLYRDHLINVATRLALAFNLISQTELDAPVPVFHSLKEFVTHHSEGRPC